jgi:hypothetical protein
MNEMTEKKIGGLKMINTTEEVTFRIDDEVRPPEKIDYTQIGLVQRMKNNEAGGVMHLNVLYLSYVDSEKSAGSGVEGVSFLKLACRSKSPEKVQVQTKSSSDLNISAWCDYVRTHKKWLAIKPNEPSTTPPWDTCLIPIEFESYSFGEVIKPISIEGKALDYIFTASGGQIPKTLVGSLLNYVTKQR